MRCRVVYNFQASQAWRLSSSQNEYIARSDSERVRAATHVRHNARASAHQGSLKMRMRVAIAPGAASNIICERPRREDIARRGSFNLFGWLSSIGINSEEFSFVGS